jgi:hypothetical protein
MPIDGLRITIVIVAKVQYDRPRLSYPRSPIGT